MRGRQAWQRLGTAMLILSPLAPCSATGQTEQTVTVDGLGMRVVSAGLATRAPEQPVVIFESGAGSPLETWNPIFRAVAEFAPILTYDRAGVGRTPWDGLQPTPERVVARLRALLDELDVAPPYVLVGHSWGGPLIHRFAGAYPNQVVGMVHIDPTDFMWSPDVERAMLESLVPGGGWVEWYNRREQQLEESRASRSPTAPTASAATNDAVNEYLEREGWKDRPAPDVPTSVIKAARPMPPPRSDTVVRRSNPNVPYDPIAYRNLLSETYVGHLRTWVRPGGEFVMATTPRHAVHAAEPEMVVDVIRRVVLGPNSAPPPSVAQDGSVESNDEPSAREAVSVSDRVEAVNAEKRALLRGYVLRETTMEEVEGDFEWLDMSAEDPSGGILRKILICYGVTPPPGRDPSDEYRSILIAIAPRSGFDDMTRYQQGWVLSFRADNRLYRVHRSGRRVTVPAANGCTGFPA